MERDIVKILVEHLVSKEIYKRNAQSCVLPQEVHHAKPKEGNLKCCIYINIYIYYIYVCECIYSYVYIHARVYSGAII